MKNELFEKAPIHKAYFSLALPVVFSMVISLVYNMVDTYFIAKTGDTNLIAGVSLSAPVFTFMIALGDIFGLGGSSVISRIFGQEKDEDGKRLGIFCFYAALLCGLFVAVILMLLCNPILYLLGANGETFSYASQYFTWIAMGAPFIIFSYTPANLLRTEGFSKASMTGTVLGAVMNMILDPIFIFGLDMGAAGAAIATVAGNICTDLFFVWFLLTRSRRLSIIPAGFYITDAEVRQIFSIGIPASFTNFMQSISVACTNRFLLPYGNDKLAAMGIVMKVNMIAILILVGFAFGAQPLIGYNCGAENKERLKNILSFCYRFECGIAAVLAIVLFGAARFLTGLFVSEPAMIEICVPMLRLQQLGMIFAAIVLVTISTFQSAGKARGAFLLSVSRQGLIFAVVIVIASYTVGYYGVLAAQAVSDFLTALLAVWLFQSEMLEEGPWKLTQQPLKQIYQFAAMARAKKNRRMKNA